LILNFTCLINIACVIVNISWIAPLPATVARPLLILIGILILRSFAMIILPNQDSSREKSGLPRANPAAPAASVDLDVLTVEHALVRLEVSGIIVMIVCFQIESRRNH